MGAGDRHLKRKEASAGACARALGKRKEEASSCAPEGYGILKKKKEAMAVMHIWASKDAQGGMGRWMDRWKEMMAKAAAAEEEEKSAGGPAKKRKRVVKKRLPKALIDHMVARPFKNIEDLTPAQLSRRSHEFRHLHALTQFLDGKMRVYEQALIDQYNDLGYAEDEREVTDNDNDDDDTITVQEEEQN